MSYKDLIENLLSELGGSGEVLNLVNIRTGGGDSHRENASILFKKPCSEVTHEERQAVKELYYRTAYRDIRTENKLRIK